MVLAIRSQVGHLQVRASSAHDDCKDTFAVQRVRDAEHRDLVDPGIGHEDVFDMFGRDLLAAPVDQLLDAPLHGMFSMASTVPRSPLRTQPSTNVPAVASGLPRYPRTTVAPRNQISPVMPAAPARPVAPHIRPP